MAGRVAAPLPAGGRMTLDVLALLLGLALLAVGAELLVTGASRLAAAAGVSPLVVGLTVVAIATSAPELAVSAVAVLAGDPDLAVGNVVGSNIANVGLILGLAATLSPLVVERRLVRLEGPIVLGASALVFALALDGKLGVLDGAVLLGGALAYLALAVRLGRDRDGERPEQPGRRTGRLPPRELALPLGRVLSGVALLVVSSRMIVLGAVGLSRALGLSDLVIGLTVVAVGTSVPEIAATVVAAMRGHRDLAVGGVLGSNLFNLLLVLGTAALAGGGAVDVAPAALHFDMPVMIVTALLCVPMFLGRAEVGRLEGAILLGSYASYVGYVVLDATAHDAQDTFGWIAGGLLLPCAFVLLIVRAARAARADRPASRAPEPSSFAAERLKLRSTERSERSPDRTAIIQ